MKPKIGDHPQCCEKAKEWITFTAALVILETLGEWKAGDDWAIRLYNGCDVDLIPIKYCPWCSRRLPDKLDKYCGMHPSEAAGWNPDDDGHG